LPNRRPEARLAEGAAAGQWIALGRVAGSYGVRGWLAVTGELEPLAASARWWIGGAAHAVQACRAHSGKLLAKLAGIESREAARALKGAAVSVPRESLPAPQEGRYYWSELIGLDVVNAERELLGVVKSMFSNGAHDVMELSDRGRDRLLPFVPQVVRRVDLEARRIEVDWGADW
jgi:16S rRNA processing protein RimM